MKKMLFLLFAVMSAATMFAAEPATEPTTAVEALDGYMWNDGKDFYVGRTLLTKQECENLLKNTCPEAFRNYDNSNKLIKAGWSTFGVGLFLTASCWVPVLLNNLYDYDTEHDEWARFYDATDIALQVWLVAGCAVTVSSIPVLCVGYSSRNKTANIYNYQCMKKEPDIRYMFTAGQNGLGFAVNF